MPHARQQRLISWGTKIYFNGWLFSSGIFQYAPANDQILDQMIKELKYYSIADHLCHRMLEHKYMYLLKHKCFGQKKNINAIMSWKIVLFATVPDKAFGWSLINFVFWLTFFFWPKLRFTFVSPCLAKNKIALVKGVHCWN